MQDGWHLMNSVQRSAMAAHSVPAELAILQRHMREAAQCLAATFELVVCRANRVPPTHQ